LKNAPKGAFFYALNAWVIVITVYFVVLAINGGVWLFLLIWVNKDRVEHNVRRI